MRLFAAVLAFVMLAASPVLAAPKFPALTGRVVDDAHVLTDATKTDLNAKLASLEATNSRQLVVVTVPSLQGYEISDFGYQLGRAWGIGQAKLNNGALLIVAPTEHKVRVEVGYGLEPILTDAFSEVLLQTEVLPKFRKGDFNGGVESGVDALIQQLLLDPSSAEKQTAAASKQLDEHSGGSSSGGAGVVPFIFGLFVFFFIFGRLFGSRFRGGLWPLLLLSTMNSGRSSGGSDWSGGSFGGGSFGGGGFSGGGGGFGGGGASGGW
jgi:uncharacterized protein